MKAYLLPILAAATAVAAIAAPVQAGDIQGDAFDCKDLWVMRNQIFKDNGYCFTTAKAINYFGNGGCSHHSQSSLHLSSGDRSVLRDIKKSESRQGC